MLSSKCVYNCIYFKMSRKLLPWKHTKCKSNVFNVRRIHTKSCAMSLGKHHNFPKHPQKADDQSLIRNIGVMAHIDAGKTTTTERMLYYSGFSTHLGDVDHGDTIMDYMEQERERGITVNSAAITFHWKHHKINLIDTPGHVDFTFEVERSLRALDGAVAILDSSAGVEAQTLTVWRQADRYSVPRIIFLNKMDKLGANVDFCLKSISKKLGVVPLLLHLPIGAERNFQGLVDLVTMETAIWSKGNVGDGGEFLLSPLSQSKDLSVWSKALKARTSLIGQLADFDNEIADLYLNDVPIEKISSADLLSALKRVTLAQKAVPVLLGSSLKNKGVQFLLDGINHFLPSPLESKNPFAKYYKDEVCALVFKITHQKQRGALTYLRLYSGNLKSGTNIYNITRENTEKVGHLYQVYADNHRDVNHACAGNIICATGLKETVTGDIITSSHAAHLKAVENFYREPIKDVEPSSYLDKDEKYFFSAHLSIPSPVFFCSIESQSMAVLKELEICLANLQREDNSLRVSVDKDSGQTILSGMGELHLEIIKDRIQKEYGIEVELGPLQVAYKETITDSQQWTEVLDKNIGDRHHFVSLTVSVQLAKTMTEFKSAQLIHSRENNLEAIRHQDLRAINNGIQLGLSNGPILNFPVCGVNVHLHSFQTQPGTSLAMISACATQAVHKAMGKASPILLEPRMRLEISTDDDYVHVILGDLARRRSHIETIQSHDDVRVVVATTPLSEMVGYATVLRTITSGTAVFSMELAQYEALNSTEQNKAIEKVTGFLPQ